MLAARVTSRRLCKSAPFRVDYVISYLKHYIPTFASYILFYPQLKPQITHGLLYISSYEGETLTGVSIIPTGHYGLTQFLYYFLYWL